MIHPVILAGGSGTRLWPLSRERYPKQLLDLVTSRTMLQDTAMRLKNADTVAPPMILCNETYRFMIAEQMRGIGVVPTAILLEPAGRNTAPALTAAALKLQSDMDEDPVLLVLPADHFIRDVPAFHQALRIGEQLAEKNYLITFGIVPESPETGYGYILKGDAIADADGPATAIARFVEKPDLDTAKTYMASGDYFWNSGMFMFRASAFLKEMKRFRPDIVSACEAAVNQGRADLDFFRLDAEAFGACPSDSIDYAVMEKTDQGAMVPLAAGWSDVGSWEALWQVGDKDRDDNLLMGDVLVHDVGRSYIRAESRLVAAVGLKNHIVVETADAVLISPRDRVQDIKKLVNTLKSAERAETVAHKTRYTPWGTTEILVAAERFQVRRVTIKPGKRLSLQKHYNRAEHWIVVRGTAQVTRDGEERILTEDSSTYIPAGVAHQLHNPGKIPLEIIEVQTGGYLGEDDVVRMASQDGDAK
jgi:mannose-1-phosphate guanylyltransferase/mannose-6-phosphate isomerase